MEQARFRTQVWPMDEDVPLAAHRVAAAFGVERFVSGQLRRPLGYEWCGDVGAVTRCQVLDFAGCLRESRFPIAWTLEEECDALLCVEIGPPDEGCKVFWEDTVSANHLRWKWGLVPTWAVRSHPLYDGSMARGLFCLGFEEEDLFAALSCPLTCHEKLELRAAMPRALRPAKWQ